MNYGLGPLSGGFSGGVSIGSTPDFAYVGGAGDSPLSTYGSQMRLLEGEKSVKNAASMVNFSVTSKQVLQQSVRATLKEEMQASGVNLSDEDFEKEVAKVDSYEAYLWRFGEQRFSQLISGFGLNANDLLSLERAQRNGSVNDQILIQNLQDKQRLYKEQSEAEIGHMRSTMERIQTNIGSSDGDKGLASSPASSSG